MAEAHAEGLLEEHPAVPSQGSLGSVPGLSTGGYSPQRKINRKSAGPGEPAQPHPAFFVRACAQFKGVVGFSLYSHQPVTFKATAVGEGREGRELLKKQRDKGNI